MNVNSAQGKTLPVWTWVAPFIIFLASAHVSQQFKAPTGSLLFYLPIPIGIILIHWWGPRVLVGLFLNSLISSLFQEPGDFSLHALLLSHETASVFASWYLFSYRQQGKVWLPDIGNVIKFIGLGIIIPVTINSTLLYFFPHRHHENVWQHLSMIWTADFASSLALSLPVLFFISPGLERLGFSLSSGSEYVKPSSGLRLIRHQRLEILFSFSSLLLLSVVLPLEKYWFIHGLFCVYIAVRFGFGLSLLANMAVFLFTYVVPYFAHNFGVSSWGLESDLLNIHFGMCLLGLTACVTGRVISDLKSVEKKLNQQYNELEQTHDELDRFVYSASHDLSAPLKSILGLITLIRLESDPMRHMDYIDKIELSAKKLDRFIKEILDYSRNSRLEKTPELIVLRDLIDEVFENFRNTERLPEIEVKVLDHKVPQVVADRMRMKIILSNLVSNAIKYQHFKGEHTPTITIQSERTQKNVLIHVEDNGHGIREEYMGKIFNMFFRGSTDSNGSGLGLYIAKEAAEKMNGKITAKSVYGRGSTFTVYLPQN